MGVTTKAKNSTIFRRMQQKMKKKEVKCSEHRNQNLNGIARDPREQLQQRHSLPPRRGGLWHLTWLLELLGGGGGVGGEWQQVRVLKVRRLAKLHYYLRVSGASRFLRCDFPRGLFGAIYTRDFFFFFFARNSFFSSWQFRGGSRKRMSKPRYLTGGWIDAVAVEMQIFGIKLDSTWDQL